MDDRVSALFSRVRSAAGNTARFVGGFTGNTIDVTKLNLQLREVNADIEALLRSAGQIVYDAHLGAETDSEMLDRILARLDEQNGKAMELRAKIENIKGMRPCPVCGTMMTAEGGCPNCNREF